MRIREESPADAGAIREVVTAAFGRPDEARLVEAIRASEHYVPGLSLVAEDGDEIVGHVMLSYVHLEGGPRDRILCLAPVAVRPDRQRRDLGGSLVRAALAKADALGEPAVVLTGHPSYYPRFGFEPARPLGIEPPDPGLPDPVFMAKALTAYDPSFGGRVRYPPAFALVG